MKKLGPSLFACLTIALAASVAVAQSSALRGQVVDEQGAVIHGARATLVGVDGKKHSATTNANGEFSIANVPAGAYTLSVEYKGFDKQVEENVQAPSASVLKITLTVAPIKAETEVKADSSGISVEPDQNMSAIVLDEKMIMDLLPDNEDDMLEFLQALAGPSAGGTSGGQGGAQIYIDGFRGGRLPPRESILQIRINQNPVSAEFAHPGAGRIEIVTKPGSEQWHSSVGFNFANSALNARNAFALMKPNLDQRHYSFTLSGPIIKKKISFFLNADRRTVNSGNIINAITLSGPLIKNVPSANENEFFGLRVGSTLTKRNVLNVGYNYHQSSRETNGGGFMLPERGSSNDSTNHTLTLTETFVVSSRLVHEARTRVQHEVSATTANANGVAINVLDAFNGGGATCCPSNSRQDQLDFQDYLTYTYKKHTVRGGLQLQYENNRDLSANNFNGSYTFSSLEQYRRAAAGEHVDPADPNSGLVRATQFTMSVGNPRFRYGQYEASLFAQDDFRFRQNVTLSVGLRYEFQSHLQDKLNLAPRFGIAWSPSKNRKTTLRTGGGLFFNRLGGSLYESTLRADGVNLRSIVIRNPIFDPLDPLGANAGAAIDSSRTVVRALDSTLHAPYTIYFQSSIERQFPWGVNGSFTHIYSRGVHFFRSRNVNAPLSDTHVRPDPTRGNVYELESNATSIHNAFMFRADRRFGRNFSLFVTYTLSWTNSDADAAQALPANSYDLHPEWGPAFTDRRNTLNIVSSLTLPRGFRFTPFILASSGGPFNITTGTDDNLDTAINDRPAGIHRNSDLPASLYPLIPNRCILNCSPGGAPVLLRDFLQTNYPNGVHAVGPGSFNANLSVSKTFALGKSAGRWAQNGPGNQSEGPRAEGQEQVSGDNQNAQVGDRGPGGPGGGRGAGGGRGGVGGAGGFGGRGGGFGGRGGGARGNNNRGNNNEGARYNIQLSAQISNLLNHVNFNQYYGTLTSPFFGRSNGARPARSIEFNFRFSF